MRIWQKILFPALAIVLVFFIFIHIFINIKGKDLLVKNLEEVFQRKVRIAGLATSFPANIRLKDVEAEGLFKIREVYAGGVGLNIFRNTLDLSLLKISQPIVTIERNFAQAASEAFVSSDHITTGAVKNQPGPNPAVPKQNGFVPPRLSINHLIVSEGTVNFIDKLKDNKDILIKVEHLNLKIDNLNPGALGSQKTLLDLKASIPWRQGQEQGKIEAGGWVNLSKKDIEVALNVSDIDGVYLHPYYSAWVDLEKARIDSAKLNFSSKISGLNNNVAAECHLELTDIVRKPLPPEENNEKAAKITDAVMDIFKAMDQGKIVLDFTIRTKMDRPEFGFSQIKMAFEDKLAKGRKPGGLISKDIFMLPGSILQRTIKGVNDFYKAVIDGTANIVKQIKKTTEGPSKK
ncbi:MAG: DUF748 domain-containing protein [Candidatus Omnitrophica bacterium]|nr:DUF748 domain-containing protein [Candidatus Omnitrophota bacterium]